MSDWNTESSNEPSAWYEHEVDESDYPRSSPIRANAASSNSTQQHEPQYPSHQSSSRDSRDSHQSGGYRHSSSQSVRDEHPHPSSSHSRDSRDSRYRGNHRDDRDRHDYRDRDRDTRDYNRDYRSERGDRERDRDRDSHSSLQQPLELEPEVEEDQEEIEASEADVVSDEDDSENICPLCMEQLDATDKQFKPCKCGYQVCLWCFPAGTPITLANGTTRPIESMTQGELLLSYDIPDLGVDSSSTLSTGLVAARNHRLIEQGKKSLIELVLEDGEALKCTPEHRLLTTDSRTNATTWKEAQLIDLQFDRVRTTIRGPTLDSAIKSDWTLTLPSLPTFDFDTKSAQQRSLTLARVCGYACPSASSTSGVALSSSFDAVAFREDLSILSGSRSHSCAEVHWTKVMLPHAINTILRTSTIPAFLLDSTCPVAMKREFVAGFISASLVASNSHPTAPLSLDHQGVDLSLTAADLYLLSPLLQSFNFSLASTLNTNDSLRFAQLFGLPYSHTLATRLAIGVSYWRYQQLHSSESITFNEYLLKTGAVTCFTSAAKQSIATHLPTYSQAIISRSMLSDEPVPVYDLMVLSSSKSPSIHSFVASSVVAHNCFHHINSNLGGKCPACRRTYDTTGQMAADPAVLEMIATKAASGGVRQRGGRTDGASATAVGRTTSSSRATAPTTDRKQSGAVPLVNVRVLQRNLLYVVGLPVQLAKDELLKSRPYFGKFGKIIKIALGIKGGGASAERKQTCSCYVTFKKGVDCIDAIKAVNGSIVLGCLLKATYGTSKYCANWLRGAPCNNPTCLYLHETADPRDCTTKDDLSAFLQETQPSTINPQAIATNGLPGATANASMLPGTAAMAPLVPMSRAPSLGTPNLESNNGDDDSYSEKPTPPTTTTPAPAPAASPISTAPPSSWASLAGSRLASANNDAALKQPGQVIHAPVEHSPSAEILMPNEIIYIVPPHLRSTTGGSTTSKKIGSRTSSNASAAPPSMDKKSGDQSTESQPQTPSLDATSPYVSSSGAGVDSPINTAALPPAVLTTATLSSLSPSQPSSNLAPPTLGGPTSQPSQPTNLQPPATLPIAPVSAPVVGSRPPPGFFGPKLSGGPPPGMPAIAPPAISQLQAPPGVGIGGSKLPPPGNLLGGPMSSGPQPIPSSQPPVAQPAISLQSLLEAFPALDPSVLALMARNLAGSSIQHSTPPTHSLSSQTNSPSNGQPKQSAPSQPLSGGGQSGFASTDSLQSMDPAIMGFSRPGQQSNNPQSNESNYFPSSQFQSTGFPSHGQISPQRPTQHTFSQRTGGLNNGFGNTNLNGGSLGVNEWDSLADDDHPLELERGGPLSSNLNTWTNWTSRLTEIEELKQRQGQPQQSSTNISQQDSRYNPAPTNIAFNQRETSRFFGGASQSTQQQPQGPSGLGGGWNDNSTLSLNGPSSNLNASTSRYRFALEDEDRFGGGSASGFGATQPSQPPQHQQWSSRPPPPGLGMNSNVGGSSGLNLNGWPSQQVDQPIGGGGGGWPTAPRDTNTVDEYGAFGGSSQPPVASSNDFNSTFAPAGPVRPRGPLSLQHYMQQRK